MAQIEDLKTDLDKDLEKFESLSEQMENLVMSIDAKTNAFSTLVPLPENSHIMDNSEYIGFKIEILKSFIESQSGLISKVMNLKNNLIIELNSQFLEFLRNYSDYLKILLSNSDTGDKHWVRSIEKQINILQNDFEKNLNQFIKYVEKLDKDLMLPASKLINGSKENDTFIILKTNILNLKQRVKSIQKNLDKVLKAQINTGFEEKKWLEMFDKSKKSNRQDWALDKPMKEVIKSILEESPSSMVAKEIASKIFTKDYLLSEEESAQKNISAVLNRYKPELFQSDSKGHWANTND